MRASGFCWCRMGCALLFAEIHWRDLDQQLSVFEMPGPELLPVFVCASVH